MTHQNDYNLSAKTVEELTRNGLEAIPELMQTLINQAMQVERAKFLQANEYERTATRKGHANGFKPKTVKTRIGEITFAVPQVREGGFYPSALEKGLRSERALMITLAEMYTCTALQAHVYRACLLARSKPSPSSCAALKFQPCKSAGQLQNWMPYFRHGVSDPWVK